MCTWNDSVSRSVIKYSTVVLKSPRIDNSLSAITKFLINSKINTYIIFQINILISCIFSNLTL